MYLSKNTLLLILSLILVSVFSIGVVDRLLLAKGQDSYVPVSEIYPNTKKWIGIGVQKKLGNQYKKEGMIQVIDVIPESPAMKAGIKKGDIIKKVNGQDILNEKEFTDMISKTPIGKNISIKIYRRGQNDIVSIKISKIPDINLTNRD